MFQFSKICTLYRRLKSAWSQQPWSFAMCSPNENSSEQKSTSLVLFQHVVVACTVPRHSFTFPLFFLFFIFISHSIMFPFPFPRFCLSFSSRHWFLLGHPFWTKNNNISHQNFIRITWIETLLFLSVTFLSVTPCDGRKRFSMSIIFWQESFWVKTTWTLHYQTL